jgi:hypothetical protein
VKLTFRGFITNLNRLFTEPSEKTYAELERRLLAERQAREEEQPEYKQASADLDSCRLIIADQNKRLAALHKEIARLAMLNPKPAKPAKTK